ncbi:hypothetical protein N0V86_008803 [Didymella sp. IMI 355093]|nr:hypothetical protein N0V86_008803 [Didymella sp. IMI 355093]
MSAPMHGKPRRSEPPHTEGPLNAALNEDSERDSAGDLRLRHRQSSILGDEPRNQTGNHRLRSVLKRSNPSSRQASRERADMATTSSEGPRQRTTESTPIAPTQTASYDSISPIQTHSAERSPQSNGVAPQDGTAGTVEPGKAQRVTENERRVQEESSEGGWWSEFWEKWGSVELENKGSVARDHLALERTFLAWLRTSLSFASIGIAITQLFRLNSSLRTDTSNQNSSDVSIDSHTHNLHKLRHLGKPLGATFIGISILMLFIGFHRYFEAQHYVIRGKFPASRGSIVIVSVVAGGLIITSLVVILATSPAVFET